MRKKKNARANKVRYGRQESMKRKRDIKKEKIGTTPINDFSLFIYLFIFIFSSNPLVSRFRNSCRVELHVFRRNFPPIIGAIITFYVNRFARSTRLLNIYNTSDTPRVRKILEYL